MGGEVDYSFEATYSPKSKENIRIKDKFYSDGTKILARRGRDDRPQNYYSKEKVRILTERRKIQKNLGSRL